MRSDKEELDAFISTTLIIDNVVSLLGLFGDENLTQKFVYEESQCDDEQENVSFGVVLSDIVVEVLTPTTNAAIIVVQYIALDAIVV